MILYLDTSALVKRYIQEPYSNEVISLWQDATDIITSAVTYAESMACFYRKQREAAPDHQLIRKLVDTFNMDWQSFTRVEVNDELNAYIDKVVQDHPLRGFDAIHLASAMIVHEKLTENFLFVCFDFRLTDAARMRGLETFPLPASL